MQAVGLTLPEFDASRCELETTPVRWQGHVLALELLLHPADLVLELVLVLQHLALF